MAHLVELVDQAVELGVGHVVQAIPLQVVVQPLKAGRLVAQLQGFLGHLPQLRLLPMLPLLHAILSISISNPRCPWQDSLMPCLPACPIHRHVLCSVGRLDLLRE